MQILNGNLHNSAALNAVALSYSGFTFPWCGGAAHSTTLSLNNLFADAAHVCCPHIWSPLELWCGEGWSVTLFIFTISLFIFSMRSCSPCGTQHPLYLYALAKTSIFLIPQTAVFSCVDGVSVAAVLLLGSILGREPAPNLHWL